MVNPNIWGDPGWVFLFSCLAEYPDSPSIDMQHNYYRFFYHMRWTLPCDSCRTNYEAHFRKWPLDQYLKSRAAFGRWLVLIYNEVRLSLNKKPLTAEEILLKLFGKEEGLKMIKLFCIEDPDSRIPQEGGGNQIGGGSLLSQMPTTTNNKEFWGLITTLMILLLLLIISSLLG